MPDHCRQGRTYETCNRLIAVVMWSNIDQHYLFTCLQPTQPLPLSRVKGIGLSTEL